MELQLIVFFILSFVVTLVYFFKTGSDKGLETRKSQSTNRFRENIIKKRLEKVTEDRVRQSKRYALETLFLQAGFRLQYVEYLMISIASSLVFGIIMMIALNNVGIGLLFLIIGYMVPKQVIAFLKNRRVSIMEQQIGSFMLMILKRYENTKDFKLSLELTEKEFIGEQPIHSELRQAVMEANLGKPLNDVLHGLGRRTGNKYMIRLADYYTMASEIGTDDIRKKLLNQAYVQYEENQRGKALMKRQLASVKMNSYIILGAVPGFALFQIITNDDYLRFMTQTTLGQAGTVFIFSVVIGSLWFINNKISAPLD